MTEHLYDPQKIFDALEEAAEAWAQAKHDYMLLEKAGEVLIGKLIKRIRKNDVPATISKEMARLEPEWEVHYKGEVEAMKNELRAKLRYGNLQSLASARQTEESTRRALGK